MTRSAHETVTSQIPALHLSQNLGWTLMTAEEAFAERRGRLSNVFLGDVLRAALSRLNPLDAGFGKTQELPASAVEEAVRVLEEPHAEGLAKANERLSDLLLLGESFSVTVGGETRRPQLRYIDWANPANNAFHIVPELPVQRARSTTTSRLDLALYVNGIPFAAIECKRSSADIEKGIGDLIRYQSGEDIAHFFQTVQLVLALGMREARYATVGTPRKFWARWREKEDADADVTAAVRAPLSAEAAARTFAGGFAEDRAPYEAAQGEGGRAVSEQDRVVHALCRPGRLLDLARRFVVLDGGVKKIARYQQFFAVRRTLERVKRRKDDGAREGGVIWHTQGSGKSLTMVMLARALALEPSITAPRIVLVTDRTDLDRQLKKTFLDCGLHPAKAASGRDLVRLIREGGRVVTTVINKFDSALKAVDVQDDGTDVFLLVDEGHRSQYGQMHARMRKVFPRACTIAFTGTPIAKKERNTYERFGAQIDAYSIDQAVADEAVVPLLYEGRVIDQTVNQAAVDAWFDRVCTGLTDKQKADLKRKYSSWAQLNQAEQTVRCIAFDVSTHFNEFFAREGWKGQLVTRSKRAAVAYKKALDDIGLVTSDVLISGPGKLEGADEVDGEPDEVQAFWGRMMTRFKDEDEYSERLVDAFTYGSDPQIIIVVDKLLTGFDAPKNSVLYLTRELKEHNLLQAIARVNRLEEGKEFGYVVDYEGVLKNLEEGLTRYAALADFDETDVAGAATSIRKAVEDLPSKHEDLWDLFRGVNAHDREAMEQHLADEARRQSFYQALAAFKRTLKIALSVAEFANDDANARRIANYRADERMFDDLRLAVRRRYQETVDFSVYERRVAKLLDMHVSATDVTKLTELVDIFDADALAQATGRQSNAAAKADLIAHAAKRTITDRMDEDPVLFERFSRLIQAAIDEFRKRRIDEAEYLRRVTKLKDELIAGGGRAVPDAVAEDAVAQAMYRSIERELFGAEATVDHAEKAATIAAEIRSIIERHLVVNFWDNPDAQNRARNDIDDYFYDIAPARAGMTLTAERIDAIMDAVLDIARKRMA